MDNLEQSINEPERFTALKTPRFEDEKDMSEIEAYLGSIDPGFVKYASKLDDAGVRKKEDVALLDKNDYELFDIPMLDWRKILTSGSAVAERPAGSNDPTVEVAPQNPEVSSNSASQVKVATGDVRSIQKRKLQKFYKIYNPVKADDTETMEKILNEYRGDYPNMWKHLEQKYIMGKRTERKKVLDTKPNSKSEAILEGIAALYRENIRELEAKYKFQDFHSPLMDDIDFKAKPIVLLVGQYSVGKTSFIRYLLNRDFPGARIGPEPTTDSFMAVMHSSTEKNIPGNAAVMDRALPFKTLQRFGMQFLNKFSVSLLSAPILESISFVDTPGILSGEKQRLGRNYDFSKVVEQFAHRADRILLLFDAHKLDISDEFRLSIETLKGHDDKVRCILNKCDQVPNQQLLRVYGALMWSLGKVFKTPEVLRVFVGSFWDEEYTNPHNADLFDAEAQDLISDLKSLPRHRVTRKINEFVKRTRQFKVHLFICEHLRGQFGWTGKDKKQKQLLASLRRGDEFRAIAEKHGLTLSDFPNPERFAKIVGNHDMKAFPKVKKEFMDKINMCLHNEVPRLMKLLPNESAGTNSGDGYNPFADNEDDEAVLDPSKRWVVTSAQKAEFDNKFFNLKLNKGKASGAQIRNIMMQSNLSKNTLGSIWNLSDIAKDGYLDHEEFALCMWLIDLVKEGNSLPTYLTVNMVPVSKRHLLEFNVTDD